LGFILKMRAKIVACRRLSALRSLGLTIASRHETQRNQPVDYAVQGFRRHTRHFRDAVLRLQSFNRAPGRAIRALETGEGTASSVYHPTLNHTRAVNQYWLLIAKIRRASILACT